MAKEVTLKRSLSLPLLTLYGLGTTIGAGIFALVGKVAGLAGLYAPLSFLTASVLAAFTAFSFAEFSARLPRSAGEAVYVRAGLQSKPLSIAVGLLVASAGIVSAAAITNGAVGYLMEFVGVPAASIVVMLVLALGLIAAWGISESVTLAAVLTVIEIGVLLLLVWVARDGFMALPARASEFWPPLEASAGLAIFAGAFLAFYAFLGFEDMVNVAEEVKNVTRVMPTGIILTLVITSVIYVSLSLVAVLNVAPTELAASGAPLALLYERATGTSPAVIGVVAIFAITNGALIQIVMASRVLYGMSAQGQLPAWLGRVNRRTRTPLNATAGVTIVILLLALWFPIEKLAEATSVIALTVFTLVNLALWRLKRREPAPEGIRVYPLWIPIMGFATSLMFLVLEVIRHVAA